MKGAVPFIEVVNREELVEAGFKFKEQIFKLKQEMMSQTPAGQVGTVTGDRII